MSMSCPAPPLPKFTFTSPADTSCEPSSVDVESSPVPLSVRRPVIIEKATDTDSSAQPQKPAGVLSAPQRLSRRQLSDNTLRPSSANFLQSNHGLSPEDQKMDSASLRRHSGQSRVPFMPLSSAEKREQQRLPLRAFKKIGRVGTLPALVNSSNPANIQLALHGSTPPQLGAGGGGSGDEVPALSGSAMSSGSRATAAGMGSAFQRWNHRRGSHLGWDSARPQSAARQQQQMLEKIYTKGELKEYQQLFKMFDTDGSGAIGSEELKGAMQSIGMEADDAEIERLIKEVDEDGNGEIDFPEFCQCMKTAERQGGFRQKPTNDEVVRQCFEVFDQDGNGLITENEFIYVAKEVGGFSHELAEFVFRELLGDSASDHLDLDRFSAIVEDYLSEHNQGDFDAEEEGPDGGGGSNK